MTPVRHARRGLGAGALRTAMRLAAGEKLDSHHVELATELVVRRSTAPPSVAPAPALAPTERGQRAAGRAWNALHPGIGPARSRPRCRHPKIQYSASLKRQT